MVESIKFANKAVSEITAHTGGVHYLFPAVTGVLEMGGRDSKVIAVENGEVVNFLMNDKCAAGTGKFLEFTAKALEMSTEALAALPSRHEPLSASAARAQCSRNPKLYRYGREASQRRVSPLDS